MDRLASLLPCLLLAACAHVTPRTSTEVRQPVTVLVSIDGFSPDYLGKGNSPVLDRLAAEGVSGALRPSFPSKTFPNHYTLVTGLRPDRHGIVGNNMFDPRRPGKKFTLSNPAQSQDPFWWDQAEPIWVTAERAGIRTASMLWPGGDVKIGGFYASDWHRYYEHFPVSHRIRGIRDWLARADAAERPRFIALYFEQLDMAGHDHGPDAPETASAVRDADAAIGRLVADAAALGQPLNLVVLSDHGMAKIDPPTQAVLLDDLLPREAYTLVNYGALVEIEPAPGRRAEVERVMLKPHRGYQCWRKGELPPRFQYGSNPRVPAIVCQSKVGWEVVQDATVGSMRDHGDHGFDPDSPEMRALFIGHGPAFRRGVALPITDNIHVYPLLARLIGIAPRPSDGGEALAEAALAR